MIEPLSILLKSIDNKPATLLRNRNGKTIARVYDDEYTPLFLSAQKLRDAVRIAVWSKDQLPAEIFIELECALNHYEELRDIHFPDKGSAA